jgi:hypothetical protein
MSCRTPASVGNSETISNSGHNPQNMPLSRAMITDNKGPRAINVGLLDGIVRAAYAEDGSFTRSVFFMADYIGICGIVNSY